MCVRYYIQLRGCFVQLGVARREGVGIVARGLIVGVSTNEELINCNNCRGIHLFLV